MIVQHGPMVWHGFMRAAERYWRFRAGSSFKFEMPACPLCLAVGGECEKIRAVKTGTKKAHSD